MQRVFLASPLLLLSFVSAQTVVSPRHFASAEANSQNRFPFGETTLAFRYLQVHDDLQGMPRLVRTMAWRRAGAPCSGTLCTVPFPAYSVTLNVWCSSATTTASTLVPAFDSNHGTDKVQVVTNKSFNFPATLGGEVPQPFAYRITLDLPLVYLGQAPLCWEVHVTGRTNTTQLYHDAVSGTDANPALQTGAIGTGCKATGRGPTMAAVARSVMSWGTGSGSLIVDGTNAPANAALAILIGFRNDSFGGTPLPFLLPGTDVAPSGPCSLYTAIAIVVPAVASASGGSTTTIPVPATPDLNGGRTFEQVLALDSAANPWGFVLSNAVSHNFVAPYGPAPVGRVYLNNNLGPSGAAAANDGLITLFDL